VIAADTSVTIAAAASWHVEHARAVAALTSEPSTLIAHGVRTVSAMSRMPEGRRLAAAVVLEWLHLWFPVDGWRCRPRDADGVAHRGEGGHPRQRALRALIAATAVHHGHRLLSADRRAGRLRCTRGG